MLRRRRMNGSSACCARTRGWTSYDLEPFMPAFITWSGCPVASFFRFAMYYLSTSSPAARLASVKHGGAPPPPPPPPATIKYIFRPSRQPTDRPTQTISERAGQGRAVSRSFFRPSQADRSLDLSGTRRVSSPPWLAGCDSPIALLLFLGASVAVFVFPRARARACCVSHPFSSLLLSLSSLRKAS